MSDLTELEAKLTTKDKIVFKNAAFEMSLETNAYQKKQGTLGNLANIDPSQWGSYGQTPNNEIKAVRLKHKSGVYHFPKNAFSKLYDINIELTRGYIGMNKEIYMEVGGADGSDSHDVIYCLKNNKLFSMTVMQTIP